MQVCSTDKDESKGIIFDESSTEESEAECVHKNVNKEKYANNEAEYEEPSVTHEVPRYFNIFECGKNILNRLDVTCEQACMSIQEEEYYTDIWETMIENNGCTKTLLSKEKLLQAINTIVAET